MNIELNTFICGDCLEVLKNFPDSFANAIITDPPYEAEAHGLRYRIRHGKSFFEEPFSFGPISFELRTSVGKEIARLCQTWAIVFCQCEAAQLWRKALEP